MTETLRDVALVVSPSDDPCDLKAECSPTMDNEISAADNEKGELEMEERKLKEQQEEAGEEQEEEQEPLTEEQQLEELRAQVLQLLLELDDARETSNKHQESFHELQGGCESPQVMTLHHSLLPEPVGVTSRLPHPAQREKNSNSPEKILFWKDVASLGETVCL